MPTTHPAARPTTARVTPELLRAVGACAEEVDRFRRAFGCDGVDVTVELCVRVAADWDWDAAADYLLPPVAVAAYCPALAPTADAGADASCDCTRRTPAEAAARFARLALEHGLFHPADRAGPTGDASPPRTTKEW